MNAATAWWYIKRNGLPPDPTNSSLLAGLDEYWPMDEVSGNRIGVVAGTALAPANAPGATGGVIGNALLLDGVNQSVALAAPGTFLRGGERDFTICCWAYLHSKLNFPPIVAKQDAGIHYEYILDYRSDTDRFRLQLLNGAGSAACTVSANTFGAPAADTWHFIACGYDANAGQGWISVNAGAWDTAAKVTSLGDSAAPFNVGSRPDGGGNLNGRIDALGFWSRKLTGAELAWLYNDGAGLVFPWTGGP